MAQSGLGCPLRGRLRPLHARQSPAQPGDPLGEVRQAHQLAAVQGPPGGKHWLHLEVVGAKEALLEDLPLP